MSDYEKPYKINNSSSSDDSSSDYELDLNEKRNTRLEELMELISWNLSFNISIEETLRCCEISNDDIVLLLEHFILDNS